MAKVAAVCGCKDSGKTTLIGRIVEKLSGEGLRVAVIKHDGHDFTCDIPGTDTYRFTESGAYAAACFSDNRLFVHRTGTGDTIEDILAMFPEADLIIIEGLKDSALPKIEVIRKEVSGRAVSNPEGRFLIATDWPEGHFDEPQVNINDIGAIVKEIRRVCL